MFIGFFRRFNLVTCRQKGSDFKITSISYYFSSKDSLMLFAGNAKLTKLH